MSTRRTRIRHRNRRRGSSRLVVVLFGSLLALGGVVVVGAFGWIVAIASTGPDIKDLKARQNGNSSKVYAADGTLLGFIQSTVVRQQISSDLIPETMRDATVAVEDRRFYQHQGVDFEGVVRAAFSNITSGKTVQGGSTLTMQLIKNLYATKERNFTRKIRGQARRGTRERAPRARGQALDPRQVPQQRLLRRRRRTRDPRHRGRIPRLLQQARPPAHPRRERDDRRPPAGTQPIQPAAEPTAALKRRNDVLARMRDQGMITAAQYDQASATDLDLNPKRYYSTRIEGYVFDYVKKQLVKEYGEKVVEEGGLTVRTTIDLKLQRAARKAIADSLTIPDPPSAAVVSVDPATGQIRAMATSANYGDRKFNLAAQGRRQPGSTAKTFALMAAVKRGVRPESTYYVSKPLNITTGAYATAADPIKVKTYDGKYGGSMNLVTATLKSDNSVYMQLALDVGPDKVKQAAVDMGIPSRVMRGRPAESLGGFTSGITPLEAANAYATIADGGYRNTPTAISTVKFPRSEEYPNGKTFDLGHPKRAKTFPNGVTGEVTKILAENVSGSGTGARARIQCPAAGKTGTTDNFRDAWFSGFTPRLATSVWVGYPDRQIEMRTQFFGSSVAGGTFPAQIWGAYMKTAVAGQPCGEWRKITEPVTASPFEGRFARSGGNGEGDETGTTPQSTTPTGGNGVDGGTKPKTTTNPATGGTDTTGGGYEPGVGGGALPPPAHERDPTG